MPAYRPVEGSKHLSNVGEPPDYTAQTPGRQAAMETSNLNPELSTFYHILTSVDSYI
jgi:hypothetical protein